MNSEQYPEGYDKNGYPKDYPLRKLIPRDDEVNVEPQNALDLELASNTRKAFELALARYCHENGLHCSECYLPSGNIVFHRVLLTGYFDDIARASYRILHKDDLLTVEYFVDVMTGSPGTWVADDHVINKVNEEMERMT